MTQYHKIQTLYLRDPDNRYKTLLEGEFAKPEFEYLANTEWVFTEKVDGTNIRIIWDGEQVKFGGKTDNAQIPAELVGHLIKMFPQKLCAEVFKGPLVLYGEGYGPKIQKGGDYADQQQVILFDALAGDTWLERQAIDYIAIQFEVPAVPIVGRGTTDFAVRLCKEERFDSFISVRQRKAEGMVLRPAVELKNRRGQRVIAKLKFKDFEVA